MTNELLWNYQAKLHKITRFGPIVDGDTQQFMLDLGMYDYNVERVRLAGVDTHETWGVSKDSEEFQKGKKQTEWVEEWYATGQEEWEGQWPFIVRSESYDPSDSFGRIIGRVIRRSDNEDLSEALIEEFGEELIYEY